MGGSQAEHFTQLDFATHLFGNYFRQVRRCTDRSDGRVRQRIMSTRDCADLAGQLVASRENCVVQVAICSECPTQCRDLDWQILLVDNSTWPDTLHQRLFADNGATSLRSAPSSHQTLVRPTPPAGCRRATRGDAPAPGTGRSRLLLAFRVQHASGAAPPSSQMSGHVRSSSSALAVLRSAVAKPSVNWPYTDAKT
jgi:hypothetical protein